VTDSLAALLVFPTCAIVGANGCYMMPHVAAAIAPRLVAARGCLLVTVDHDKRDQGAWGAARAMRAAESAGLVLALRPLESGAGETDLGGSVRPIELGEHKDLADAWRAGWRWVWPKLPRTPAEHTSKLPRTPSGAA